MNHAAFDRIARAFGTRLSRRAAVFGAGAAAIGVSRSVSANQLTPATCGASGDVCTMLMGCCDGLTCVTSSINVNYGVCVAGEGGTVSIGTTLISPFSENVEEEVAAIAASDTASTTTTTDPTVEREQRLAEIKARKDARRSEQKTRRTTKQTEQQNRRDDQQERRELRRGPLLRLVLSQPGTENETIRVTNQDDQSVVLDEIASYLLPSNSFSFATSRVLGIGDSLLFLSGVAPTGIEGNKVSWTNREVCDTSGDGFVLTAGFSSTGDAYEYVVLCDGTQPSNDEGDRRNKRKRKRNDDKGKNKN